MRTIIDMNHQVVKVTSTFDDFTRNLEVALGRLDPTIIQKVGAEPAFVEAHLKLRGAKRT